jgi:hypothetical protein
MVCSYGSVDRVRFCQPLPTLPRNRAEFVITHTPSTSDAYEAHAPIHREVYCQSSPFGPADSAPSAKAALPSCTGRRTCNASGVLSAGSLAGLAFHDDDGDSDDCELKEEDYYDL